MGAARTGPKLARGTRIHYFFLSFSAMASWIVRQSTLKSKPWKPLEMIFVWRPRKKTPETPSLATTWLKAWRYEIATSDVCLAVLSTRIELEHVSETADAQKPMKPATPWPSLR